MGLIMKDNYFDITTAAQEANIPANILQQICTEAKAEFSHDPMMYELHVLRAIKSRFWTKKNVSAKQRELVPA
jgi:hypothetical protein